jgi:hypothetical protein
MDNKANLVKYLTMEQLQEDNIETELALTSRNLIYIPFTKKLAPQGSHCKKFYLKGVRKPPHLTSGNIRKSHQCTNLKTSAFATTYLQTFQYLQIYQLLLQYACRLGSQNSAPSSQTSVIFGIFLDL